MALEARVLDLGILEHSSIRKAQERKSLNKRQNEYVLFSLAQMCDFSRDIKAGKKPYLVMGKVTEFGEALHIFSRMSPPHPIVQKHPNAIVRLYEKFDVVSRYTQNRTEPKPSLSKYLKKELSNYELFMDIVNASVLHNVMKAINEKGRIPREIRLIKLGQNGSYGGNYIAYKIESWEVPSLQRHTFEKKVDYRGLIKILDGLMLTGRIKPRDIRILYNNKENLFEVYAKR